MQIEKGKFYRLRNGSKMECWCTDFPGEYPIRGRLWETDGRAYVSSWRASGRYADDVIAEYDVVAEWEDPRQVELWVVINKLTGGFDTAYETKSEAEDRAGNSRTRSEWLVIKVTGTEVVE